MVTVERISAAEKIAALYEIELAEYCAAKQEAAVCQLNYWETEDRLATYLVMAEASAIASLTREGQPKLTEYVLKARVKEAVELDDLVLAARDDFGEARGDREAANSALAQARERLTRTKNNIALLTAGID